MFDAKSPTKDKDQERDEEKKSSSDKRIRSSEESEEGEERPRLRGVKKKKSPPSELSPGKRQQTQKPPKSSSSPFDPLRGKLFTTPSPNLSGRASGSGGRHTSPSDLINIFGNLTLKESESEQVQAKSDPALRNDLQDAGILSKKERVLHLEKLVDQIHAQRCDICYEDNLVLYEKVQQVNNDNFTPDMWRNMSTDDEARGKYLTQQMYKFAAHDQLFVKSMLLEYVKKTREVYSEQYISRELLAECALDLSIQEHQEIYKVCANYVQKRNEAVSLAERETLEEQLVFLMQQCIMDAGVEHAANFKQTTNCDWPDHTRDSIKTMTAAFREPIGGKDEGCSCPA